MRPHHWDRIGTWWADLFGCEKSFLWKGFSVGPHAGLGGYPGIFVAQRPTGCHVSLPEWAADSVGESLSQQGVSQICTSSFWRMHHATSHLSVLGPSVHSYTDLDPGGARLERAGLDNLACFKAGVGEADWSEGGFTDKLLELFVIRDSSGDIVAAANLTDFLGHPADVGVAVLPGHRGQGLGRQVGRAATSYAVRQCGIARWRALATNVPSRKLAVALGFEDYCDQLAIR